MGCYKRKLKKGTRWFYSGQYLNQKYHSKAIYITKSECAKAERDKLKELDEKARNPDSDILLRDLCTEKLDQIKLNQSKAHYQESHRYFKMLINDAGNVPVTQVNKAQILSLLNKFSKELKERNKSNYNLNSMLRILKSLFYMAINNYEIQMRNPCVGIKEFPIDKKIKFIPTNEMIQELLLKCDDEERLLIAFVMETGCRINEALRFSDKDILIDDIVLYTRKSKNSHLTSRKIPIPDCIKNLQFSGRLFKRWMVHPKFLEKQVYRLNHQSWGYHNLRHRYASLLSRQKMPFYRIMELLGHQNLSTTQIYLQTLP